MPENVVTPFPLRHPSKDPNPEVIAQLEAMLERAKAGEIVGLAYVVEAPDAGFGTGYHRSGNLGFALTAGAQVLARRMVADLGGGDA
jgi:hypothetical protein